MEIEEDLECIDEDYDEIFMNMEIDIIKKYIKLMLVNFDDQLKDININQEMHDKQDHL